MPPTKPAVPATEDHVPPARAGARRGREVLVAAFPSPRALPVPLAGDVVGRDWLAAHDAPDPRVSARHVVFRRRSGLVVEDAGSRNGTWINGRRLAPREQATITDGALVRIGRTLLVFRDDFHGSDSAAAPIDGRLVGPFGLRGVADAIEALRDRPRTNVLIEGETGTGKELLARAVAAALGRMKPYGPVNVAGLATGVFEAQLFGYVPGAYSGSGKGSAGLIREHEGGALFLDEIGELSLELQAKVLRVLENREVLPVGGVRPVVVDVLIVAATHRNLEEAVGAGTFRHDLLARLATRIELPPLRERIEDVFAIAQQLTRANGEDLSAENVEVEALERIMLHELRANVRELAALLDRAFATDRGPKLRLEPIERALGPLATTRASALTLELVTETIRAAGSESEAARRLGITRGKLRRFLVGQNHG